MLSLLTLTRDVRRRTSLRTVLAASVLVAVVVVPSVYAHVLEVPSNTGAPTLVAVPVVGSRLELTPGHWSGGPTSSTFEWLRCPRTGGMEDGSDCTRVSGPIPQADPFPISETDLGFSFRAKETATNASGSASAVSAATPAVEHSDLNALGCPSVQEAEPIGIDEIRPPARLLIIPRPSTPAVITRSTQRITLRFEIVACDHQTVRGALVYANPTPFQQFTGPERATGATGVATITLTRKRFFPATPRQQRLIVFVRARNPREELLGGVSSRRLVAYRVRLR